MPCPTSPNQIVLDQSHFWDTSGVHWNTHRIGWAVAGGCTAITIIISAITILQHCRNYTVPDQQRQIIRILYMPPVYALLSFFSYRFYRHSTYYTFFQPAYEAATLSAFFLLITDYVADTGSGHSVASSLARKYKKPLPIPFCCWRYRPTKPYFMYTIKWLVMQYSIVQPVASIVGIICEAFDVLCDNDSYSWKYASVYILAIDFVSTSIASYGLSVFQGLVKEELAGHRPVAKFQAIQLIVSHCIPDNNSVNSDRDPEICESIILKAGDYWTVTNIKDGLNALLICIEAAFFSAFMRWAYTPTKYARKNNPPTSIWRPLFDSINFSDFAIEIWSSICFFYDYTRGKPTTRGYVQRMELSGGLSPKANFGQAFGVISTTARPPLRPSGRLAPESSDNIVLKPNPFASVPGVESAVLKAPTNLS